MIWFNNDDYVLTPNYYVQSLFSNNQGDYSLPTEIKMNSIEKDDTLHGGIVLGSWGTQNEFKDVTADYGDNVIDNIAPNDEAWIFGSGNWSVNDEGALVQSGDETGSTAWIDSPNTKVRTLSLKAKKTAGGEGFQIGVAAEDGQNYYRVNIGGWGNTTAKIQHIVDGVSAETGNVAEQSYVGNVHINDNEWYDVRIEVTDYEIKAYLNDEFICSYTKPHEYGPVYASSVYDEENGEVIVRLVNTLNNDVNIGVNIDGANVSHISKTTVMAGDTSLENSLKNKNAITPKDGQITNVGNSFTYNAPANSLSIIHLSSDNNTVHTPYISGYTDGTFRPDSTITRAEAAAIIAKLAGIDENKTYANTFSDVSADAWYANAVNFVKDKEYISGYENNTFKPENSITRAEFAVLIGKYIGIMPITPFHSEFSDVRLNFWASRYINAMLSKSLISGYEDGTFKPDSTITRAEAVTMINKAVGRSADSENSLENPFSDVNASHWAYNQILGAVH